LIERLDKVRSCRRDVPRSLGVRVEQERVVVNAGRLLDDDDETEGSSATPSSARKRPKRAIVDDDDE